MAEIHLQRKHTIGLKKAKVAAQKVADELKQEYGVDSEWDGDVLRFRHRAVEGVLAVRKDEVSLDAKLGFLLSAFKSKIENHINDDFDRYFA